MASRNILRKQNGLSITFVKIGTILTTCYLAGCSKLIPFHKQTFRAVDDKQIITLNSLNELEFSTNGTNFICQYTEENNTMRITLNAMGATQAIYYQVIPQGLKGPDGLILYEPLQYQTVMNQINAQRRQVQLNEALQLDIQRGDGPALSNCLDQGGQVEHRDISGLTPLIIAIQQGRQDLVEVLLSHKADVNAPSQNGETPLMIAAAGAGGHTLKAQPLAKLLLARGANINAKNRAGETALMYAVINRNLEVIKFLVQSGADRDIRDLRSHRRAFDYASSSEIQTALRTNSEQQRFEDEHQSTKVIGKYREDETYSHQLKGGVSVLTDAFFSSAFPGGNSDIWFGDIVGDPSKTYDSFRHFNVMINIKPQGLHQCAFSEQKNRDQFYDDLSKALADWRRKFRSQNSPSSNLGAEMTPSSVSGQLDTSENKSDNHTWVRPGTEEAATRDQADAELNQVYKNLMFSLNPAQQTKLRDDERTWIKWRDAEAARIAHTTSVGGSAFREDYANAMTDLIQKRTKMLKAQETGNIAHENSVAVDLDAGKGPQTETASYTTPASGSVLRKEILDVIRIPTEKHLGQSVMFKVNTLRTTGDWAFFVGTAIQPNGRPVDYRKSEAYKDNPEQTRVAIDAGELSGSVDALMKRMGTTWTILAITYDATDVHWLDYDTRFGAPKKLIADPIK